MFLSIDCRIRDIHRVTIDSNIMAMVASRWEAKLPRRGPGYCCADSDGSKGNWTRAWKLHRQALSDETGITITVCTRTRGGLNK